MTHPASTGQALPVTGLASHKKYTIRRSTAFAGLSFLALATAWGGVSGWYILNKDDLAARLIARETARQYAYEDRIAALRADIDRLASRALLDQDGVEARVDELATRQADLESKQALVTAVTGTLQAAGLAAPDKAPLRSRLIKPEEAIRASSVTSFAPIAPGKPMPAPDSPGLRSSEAPKNDPWQSGEAEEAPKAPAQRVAETLSRLDRSLNKAASAQLAALRQMDQSLAESQKTLRGALAETGLDTDRMAATASIAKGVGGPFVPFKIDASAGLFEATLSALQPRIAALYRLRGLIEQLPLRKPMPGEVDMTSNYGYRVDPFTRSPAMHTGIDFRAETGTPVHATAPGKVVTAEYTGGYGNMVEIEHAGGISTRYAHMSAISVSAGQNVTSGTVVGRVGTTGRSTGPHLHYETRIEGDPIDPTRFVRAGIKLAGQL
jgi:murein DD-endopeptidase MepM/ murein hydrolase activator NlpD